MKLFHSYLKKCKKIARDNKVKIKRLSECLHLHQIFSRVSGAREYSGIMMSFISRLPMNYGSRDESTRGMRRMAQDVADMVSFPLKQ